MPSPSPVTAVTVTATDRSADPLAVLWYDGPAAVLAGPCPGAGDDGWWGRAVSLGALGRYAEAAAILERQTTSRAASTRASHLRQVGRHTDAEVLDLRAFDLAATTSERADATSGLVADALGAGDAGRAFALLPQARAAMHDDQRPDGTHGGWRSRTRLSWVMAELALLVGEARTAAADADEAVTAARTAGAPRHLTKSLLIRGVARQVLGDDGAAIDLLTAVESARAQGLVTLAWPAAVVAARAVPARAAELRAVARGSAADIVAGLGPDGPAFAARPDVAALLTPKADTLPG